MNEKYDIAIIGSGPAGISAALNIKIRNKKFILFGSSNLSSKLERAPKVNNYLGFYNVSGEELKKRFHEHMKQMDIQITEERIDSIYSMGECFLLAVNDKYYEAKTIILATGIDFNKEIEGEEQITEERIDSIYSMGECFLLAVNDKYYEAKTIILATGIDFNKEIEGEEEFLGHGVGYCATCDAPLYKGRTVSIISYHKDGEKDANYVQEIAEKVYYIPMYKGKYKLKEGIEVVIDRPTKIEGTEVVKKLTMQNRVIFTDGVFLLRESLSPKQLVPGLEIENNHIIANRKMETNIPGCFAAGDCIGAPYQYIKAAGEGNIAALSAVSYLDETYI